MSALVSEPQCLTMVSSTRSISSLNSGAHLLVQVEVAPPVTMEDQGGQHRPRGGSMQGQQEAVLVAALFFSDDRAGGQARQALALAGNVLWP